VTNSFISLGSNIQFSTNTEKEQVIIKKNYKHIFGGIIEIYHACKWYLPKKYWFGKYHLQAWYISII
jgi:hypothetical protein